MTDSDQSSGGGPPALTSSTRGLPLGWRLALSTTLIVILVMGTVAIGQELRQTRWEREASLAALAESLAPLLLEIREATELAEIETALSRFHRGYVLQGRPEHQLRLDDADGKLRVATYTGPEPSHEHTFEAKVSVASAAIPGGQGSLRVWRDASAHDRRVAERRATWALHVIVTSITILLFLHLAIRIQVVRPLASLREGVRKMGMGYWGEDLDFPSAAWEIRWLAWRFRTMGEELERTVQQLLAAERLALENDRRESADRTVESATHEVTPALLPASRAASPLRSRLTAALELLTSGTDRAADVTVLAREAWDRLAAEAEQAGEIELRNRLENAALRILDPSKLRRVELRIAKAPHLRGAWIDELASELSRALDRELVPYVELAHRIKHAAGVWRKMQTKGLAFGQIHDLVAFRLVVPTASDCYWALGVVHQAFAPVVGRFNDFIAAPKPNGYQSLHTCLSHPNGPIFELQIRSVSMHRHAETGAAAHSVYRAESASAAKRSGAWSRRFWREVSRLWRGGQGRRSQG